MDPVVNRSARYFIPVAKPEIGIAEYESVMSSMRTGWVSQGERVVKFENAFAATNGRKFGVSCGSGTLALQLALMAAGCEKGSPVVCPALTMVAVPNAILAAGGRPVFVDSEPTTGNPNILAATKAGIKAKSRFYVCPSLYGEPPDIPDTWHGPGLRVIGDNAEAHYAAAADGQPLATKAFLACYSFYANKIITTGEGGMVLTDLPEIAELLRSLRAHAFTPGDHFHHQRWALGCRMTEMQAAIGLAQHVRHKVILAKRTAIAQRFLSGLAGIPWLEFPARSPGSVWWVFPLLVSADGPIDRDRLRAILADFGVDTRTYFWPMHRQPHLVEYADGQEFPIADDLARRGFYLGVYPGLSEEKIDYICNVIKGAV